MMTIAITITTSIILKLNRLASAILFILRLFYSVYGCKYTAFWENMQIIEQKKRPKSITLERLYGLTAHKTVLSLLSQQRV